MLKFKWFYGPLFVMQVLDQVRQLGPLLRLGEGAEESERDMVGPDHDLANEGLRLGRAGMRQHYGGRG